MVVHYKLCLEIALTFCTKIIHMKENKESFRHVDVHHTQVEERQKITAKKLLIQMNNFLNIEKNSHDIILSPTTILVRPSYAVLCYKITFTVFVSSLTRLCELFFSVKKKKFIYEYVSRCYV